MVVIWNVYEYVAYLVFPYSLTLEIIEFMVKQLSCRHSYWNIIINEPRLCNNIIVSVTFSEINGLYII